MEKLFTAEEVELLLNAQLAKIYDNCVTLFKKEYDELYEEYDNCYSMLEKVEKENKEQRKEIGKLKKEIRELTNTISFDSIDAARYRQQNVALVSKMKVLREKLERRNLND